MAIDANIDSVETADAAPFAAPFKISDKATKDTLAFEFTITADDLIRAWRVRFDPADRNVGQLLDGRGMVCGSGDRCGSPLARTLVAASPIAVSGQITESEVHGNPDGDYPVEVFAMIAGEWN